ncbi:MAG TPA: exodeoxyribonuclease VII large subunit [Candidatus Sumerlaeota bacterium]|nr:exodeoxyribonuclease VII large subunit [Candidatus Sumerlaeota bacterium]HPK01911.1 exodeoxyribonuclease VII large subunit [Candidatus Sumerlaeota bacterium]
MSTAGNPPTLNGLGDRPLTVSELSWRVQHLLEEAIGYVRVEGEVSGVRIPSSGHCYFVLKDERTAINAVCFRSTLARQKVRPADGMKLEVRGRVTAYTARSEYQVIVDSLAEAGLGELMRRYLELKDQLAAQGLFDEARKRPIPRLPRRIGIVTSATGAALRDMLNVLGRRARGITIYLAPAAVQGAQAAPAIVAALQRLQRHGRAEVIIVGRGGGSIEDLWAFNEEPVVRAIAACSIPVISAVGHQTDTTLADFAADLRAPTPSAAAELVTAHYGELAESLAVLCRRLARAIARDLERRRARLDRCRHAWGLRRPPERLQLMMQRLDDLAADLTARMQRTLRDRRDALAIAGLRLGRCNPRARLELLHTRLDRLRAKLHATGPARWGPELRANRERIDHLRGRLHAAMRSDLQRARLRLAAAHDQLRAVSPEAVLQRGYSIVTHGKRDRIVKHPDDVKVSEIVRIRSAGGAWRAAALPPGDDLFE